MAPLTLPPRAELVRFVLAGTVNTSVSYIVYACGLWFGVSYPLANLAATIAGVLIGFLTQGLFVFKRFEARRFPLFVLAWSVLWGLNVLLIRLLLPHTGGNAYVAGAIATGVMILLSFGVQKYVVFAGEARR